MKQYFSLLTMILLSFVGLAFVSCVEPEEPEIVVPVFPEAVTEALEAGESYTIEFEPNTDWSISLDFDKESAGWFWIQNGNFEEYGARGKAGEKAVVTICAGGQTDYDSVHSCTVVLKMAGESKTIGTFTRGTVEREFSLAYCTLEDPTDGYVYDYEYNFEVDNGLKYMYEPVLEGESPVIPITWIERTQDFRRSIIISANFDWHLKSKPEWIADLEKPAGRAGELVEFNLEGDVTKYPLENATAELVFCAKKNTDSEYTYTIDMEGCGDIFRISGIESETRANMAGEINKNVMGEDTWSDAETGLDATILGIDGLKVYTFVYFVDIFNSYWDNDEMNTGWITTALDPWNEENGVLQNRNLNIKVSPNDGPEREAIILAIPESAAPEYDYSIFPNGMDMDPQYEQYVVTRITQDAYKEAEPEPDPSEIEVSFVTPETVTGAVLEYVDMINLAGMIEKYPQIAELEESVAGNGSKVAILKYTSEYPENAAIIVPEYSWLDVKPGMEGPEWLSYAGPTDVDGQRQMTITMAKPEEGAAEYGIMNFYKSMTSPNAEIIIFCIPAFADPDQEPDVPVITSQVSFLDPAGVTGATLEPVAMGNLTDMVAKYPQITELKENVEGNGCDVVILTYTSDSPQKVAVVVPTYKLLDCKPGMAGPEWLSYDDPTTVDGKKVVITIHMEKPAEGQPTLGIMNFYKTMTSHIPEVIIYCIPAF